MVYFKSTVENKVREFFLAIGKDPPGIYLAQSGDANHYRALAINKQTNFKSTGNAVSKTEDLASCLPVFVLLLFHYGKPIYLKKI